MAATTLDVTISAETAGDAQAIERLHERSFGPGRFALTAYRLREHVTHFVYEHTGRSPLVIPVVNVISGKGESRRAPRSEVAKPSAEQTVADQQRYQEMRARLLA